MGARAQPKAVPGHSRGRCCNDPTTHRKPHTLNTHIHIYIHIYPKAYLRDDHLWFMGELRRLREAAEAEALYHRLCPQLHAPGPPSQLRRRPACLGRRSAGLGR
jgi:hypothetical protein